MMFKPGQIITNGTSAGEVLERVDRDPHWKVPGWKIRNIGMSQFGGNTGMTSVIPDYLCGSWKVIIPGRWFPIEGGELEARYTWSHNYHHLQKEHQVIGACVPEHGDGQPDCPRCWHRSPRNPEA